MKKQICIAAIVAAFSFAGMNSYAQGFQRKTVEERVKMVHDKMDSAFKLSADQQALVDSVFTNSYKTSDAAREEMMAAGNMDQDARRAKMQEITKTRDEKLKNILTPDQMKIWKETIEPSMRPVRPNRPPGQ